MAKIILGIIGFNGCGKTTVAEYLKDKHQAEIFGFSGPLREVLNLLLLEKTRENLQLLSRILRENFGQDLLSKILVNRVNNATAEVVCIEGVRRPKDVDYLREIPNFHLLGIETDEKICYDRMIKRGQNAGENNMTFEQFQVERSAESETLIGEVAKEASFTITNNGTKEEFYQKIEDVLINMKNEKK